MRKEKLQPHNNQKSFYGKAYIIRRTDGIIELMSYDTIVGFIDRNQFHRTWNGYSVTTLNHVNSFLQEFGLSGGNKAWWNSLPIARRTYIDTSLMAV